MAGTISFGGIGSGIDTEGIVAGLVGASRGQQTALKARQSTTESAVSTLSSISSLLGNLQKAVNGLAATTDVGSYSASSSNAAVAVSANGTALPGAYKVSVTSLAQEQRNYSSTYASSSTALGLNGTFNLQVGSGTAKAITIEIDDSLDEVATKINGAGLRASASVFYDGSQYRLQVRGLDTGAANSLTFSGDTTFGLNDPGSRYQEAKNAALTIDDFAVTSPTNQIVGAIQGVTLALTDVTTAPVTVKVESDPKGLETKMKAVVDAYNSVISKVHETAGYGTTKGSNAVLSGDSALRSLTQSMSNAVLSRISGAGTHGSLADLGLSLGRDGKLALDSTKLGKAITADASSVASVLAGAGSGAGVMDIMGDLTKDARAADKGLLALRKEALSNRATALKNQVDREEDRLTRYAETLRKQFTAMDSTVATNNSLLSYLQKF